MFIATLAVPLITLISAVTFNANAASKSDYLQHDKFTAFLNTVVKEDGHDKQAILDLFNDAERKDSILKAIARPAEKRLTWEKYQDIFLTKKRAEKGVEFYKKHKSAFKRANDKYGVPPEIILAIIGVETRYGGNKGSYRVIDALSTLAFDYPPRSKFFTKQLRQYLLLGKEAGIDLKSTTGSYAGAMGFPQFIPSSYRHYAVDFDNDNIIDLINNPIDAIGSVANYFSEHGWVSNAPITSPARFLKTDGKESDLDNLVNQSLKPSLTIEDFNNAGLVGDKAYNKTLKATAIRLKGKQGNEYWIGLNNFYVITRYNHSKLYAMAVYQLSETLKSKIK
ncbi:lytic murein transglycosylase B [Gammaproteobacteria bacterium 42_54_T18]|nr:lytic murein transglycosylase B [Gammaproteobacteria bacterium 42_54_T18]